MFLNNVSHVKCKCTWKVLVLLYIIHEAYLTYTMYFLLHFLTYNIFYNKYLSNLETTTNFSFSI